MRRREEGKDATREAPVSIPEECHDFARALAAAELACAATGHAGGGSLRVYSFTPRTTCIYHHV